MHLLNKFLNALHNMFVELDGLDCCTSNGCHFRFRYWRFRLIQRLQLKQKQILYSKFVNMGKVNKAIYLMANLILRTTATNNLFSSSSSLKIMDWQKTALKHKL